jgi:LCP family protein required for cell wall assembly
VRRALERGVIACCVLGLAAVIAGVAVTSAWLGGAHIPLVTGATYLRVEKIPPLRSADRIVGGPTRPFFLLLVGNDSRPGVGGARGDALHVLGINPARRQASMIDVPRDTCWQGDKINVGNTHGPRAQADAVGGLLGVSISFVVDVDFAGFIGLVDGVGGVDVNVPVAMHDSYSGAYFSAGVHHMSGLDALAFSRDRHDFPQSDIVRTANQGLLILDAMRGLGKKMQSAAGEFQMLALLGRHAQLDGVGIKDLYRLGRLAFVLKPDRIKSLVVPYSSGGNCLTPAAAAAGLFADFRDDAVIESH